MKLYQTIFMMFFMWPYLAIAGDNTYLSYYTKISKISDGFNNRYIGYYNLASELVVVGVNAHAREQSTVNKLLTSATIAATGIGGMNLMSGLARQSADQDAQRDMQAYLATFACDYGNGRNIKGGDVNIVLPGGNALLPLVTEYKKLAADLHQRKQALGLSPGIESDVVLGASETGLYNNAAVGKTGGAYASLARALLDESSADAAAWREQTSAAENDTKTGLAVGAVGVVGGTVGNIIESINYNKNN